MAARRQRSRSRQRGVQKDGDWYCPKCYDLQFKSNDACRLCGLGREEGVASLDDLDAENFLTGHDVDDKVAEQFHNLSPELKKAVMSGGSMAGARDGTAVLIKRMSKAQCPREGDWYCPHCQDHQFAKNDKCRSCGTGRPEDGAPQGAPPTAESFLENHNIDDHAQDKFFQMEEADQQAVIARGSLHGARDPTAVLLSRINQLRDGSKGGGKGSRDAPRGGKSGLKGGGGKDDWSAGYEAGLAMLQQHGQVVAVAMMQQQAGGGCGGSSGAWGSPWMGGGKGGGKDCWGGGGKHGWGGGKDCWGGGKGMGGFKGMGW